MIVDVHMHLGNFLYRHGAEIIGCDIPFPTKFSIQTFEERVLRFNSNTITKMVFDKLDDYYTKSVQSRIRAATLRNLQSYYKTLETWSTRLFGDSHVESYCMPISPYVTFRDIRQWTILEKRLRTFTSINPSLSLNAMCEEIASDAKDKYCFGLKIHPIIQGIPFDSKFCFNALDIFRLSGKPVLFHAGASRYYIGNERNLQHCELDNKEAAVKMVAHYPDVPFIIGHAGIAEFEEWAQSLRRFDNVFFEVTVQSCKNIQKLVRYYGEDRMLFATDWPCIDPKVTCNILMKALTYRQLEKAMFRNAFTILGER